MHAAGFDDAVIAVPERELDLEAFLDLPRAVGHGLDRARPHQDPITGSGLDETVS
jgi:hypothetical protein